MDVVEGEVEHQQMMQRNGENVCTANIVCCVAAVAAVVAIGVAVHERARACV